MRGMYGIRNTLGHQHLVGYKKMKQLKSQYEEVMNSVSKESL